MKLPKSLTTVTSISKIIALVLFIYLPFLGFWLGTYYQKKIDLPFVSEESQTRSPGIIPTPTYAYPTKENVYIETVNDKRIFHEKVHGYTMDVTRWPDLTLPPTNSAASINDSIDMYLYPWHQLDQYRLITRLIIYAPVVNKEDLPLEEYANRYVVRVIENTYCGSGTSSFTHIKMNNNSQAISWCTIYTDDPEYQPYITGEKEYLVRKNGMIVHFKIWAHSSNEFERATTDFDEVIKTFDFETK